MDAATTNALNDARLRLDRLEKGHAALRITGSGVRGNKESGWSIEPGSEIEAFKQSAEMIINGVDCDVVILLDKAPVPSA